MDSVITIFHPKFLWGHKNLFTLRYTHLKKQSSRSRNKKVMASVNFFHSNGILSSADNICKQYDPDQT